MIGAWPLGERISTAVEDVESIKSFVELVDATADDEYITFPQLQTHIFMKFWLNLIICRFVKDQDDFRIIFFELISPKTSPENQPGN
jgi:hypothetical protein